MKTPKLVTLCAWSLGLVLLSTPIAYAQRVFNPVQQQTYSSPAVLEELARARVIYLGETHNKPEDHAAQLQIIKDLHERNPRIAIAMEMFQRPFQRYLDRYVANDLSEEKLRENTEYKDRWGYPWENYAPVLRFAKANRLPVIALNAPTEVVRKVARRGLNRLSRDEQRYIPPLAEIQTDDPAYRQVIQEIYEQAHQGKGNSGDFERFFQAQVVWDETMADGIARFVQANPDFQVIVLAGQGHIAYGYGIPSRVARRLDNIVQRTILLNPSEPTPPRGEQAAADLFWFTFK
jgi:uncharacterized iron-regulated protein